MAPTVAPTVAPTNAPGVVTNSTDPARQLVDSSQYRYGTFTAGSVVQPSAVNTPIDGLICGPDNRTGQYFHFHVSLYVNGQQIGIPTAIGQYLPVVKFPPDIYDIDTTNPASCIYELRTYAAEGMGYASSGDATKSFNLGEFFDIWAKTLSLNGFGSYTGPTRVFVTDLTQGADGAHPVVEITGQDPHSIVLKRHQEYTIEVGSPSVNTPNYVFYPANI
ncbi:MAG: hypothetical protein NVSMB64_25520 [Candidatus Velthaea sp.]